MMLLVTLKMTKAPQKAALQMRNGTSVTGAANVSIPVSGKFVRYGLPLKCLRDKGGNMSNVAAPFVFETDGAADYQIGEVRLGTDAERKLPCR